MADGKVTSLTEIGDMLVGMAARLDKLESGKATPRKGKPKAPRTQSAAAQAYTGRAHVCGVEGCPRVTDGYRTAFRLEAHGVAMHGVKPSKALIAKAQEMARKAGEEGRAFSPGFDIA
jgi:hypothetical protein